MDTESAKVLIIEDNQGDAFLVNEFLIDAGYNSDNIFIENTLQGGLKKLANEKISIILTDLGLPDSNREDTINSIINENSKVPIIILSGVDDQKIATDSVNNGVQDYLIKGKFDSYILLHSINYALLRFEHEQKLKELSDFKSKLFRIVSHDLKGPMGALYTYIEMMVEDFNDMPKEDLKQDLTCLEEISKSLLNLIENLFSWARVQIGSIEINPEIINVKILWQKTLALVSCRPLIKIFLLRTMYPMSLQFLLI